MSLRSTLLTSALVLGIAGPTPAIGQERAYAVASPAELELEVGASFQLTATLHGAELLGQQHRLGAIAEGMMADIIAVPRDPVVDIRALMDVEFVMKDGTIVRDDR